MDSSRLAEAVKENRLELVQARVAEHPGALTAALDFLGHTLLHLAALHGQHDMAGWLLERGAPASARSTEGRTPLHLACQLGDLRMAELLVRAGADPNAADVFRMTPLHWAVEKNQPEIVRLLCEQEALDVAVADRQGRTSLAIAARKGLGGLVEMLTRRLGELRLQEPPRSSPASSSRPPTVIDSSMIPTNPFGKRKSYAKALPVNCRASCPIIVERPPPPEPVPVAVQPPPENKNKVRIDVLDDDSSDEETTAAAVHGGHRSRADEEPGQRSKKRQLSFSPNTILDDTLYWLKRQALAAGGGRASASADFSLGGRELVLTEAGRLALKYMNETEAMRNETSLLAKLARDLDDSEAAETSVESLVDALDDGVKVGRDLVQHGFFSEHVDALSGLLNVVDPASSTLVQPDSLNLFDLNALTDELNLDDCL